MPPLIPRDIYIHVTPHSSPPLKMTLQSKTFPAQKQNIATACDCPESRLCWRYLVCVEMQLQFTILHVTCVYCSAAVLQCCRVKWQSWGENGTFGKLHPPKVTARNNEYSRGVEEATARHHHHLEILMNQSSPHHSPSCTSLVSGQFQRTYSGSVIALKIGTLRGSWMGQVSAPSLHWRPCLGQRISKSSIIFFLLFFGMLLALLSRI